MHEYLSNVETVEHPQASRCTSVTKCESYNDKNNTSPCTAAPPARTPHQPYSWCLMFHGKIGRRGTVLEKTPSAELCAVEELHVIEQT